MRHTEKESKRKELIYAVITVVPGHNIKKLWKSTWLSVLLNCTDSMINAQFFSSKTTSELVCTVSHLPFTFLGCAKMEFLNGIFCDFLLRFLGTNSSLLRLKFLSSFYPHFSVLKNAVHEQTWVFEFLNWCPRIQERKKERIPSLGWFDYVFTETQHFLNTSCDCSIG